MWNEEELVEALARGEEFALEILFERHCGAVWKYILVILKSREDAKEVLNETFFRVFRYAANFSGRGSFSGWLFRIARNICMDRLRKRKSHIKLVSDIKKSVESKLSEHITDGDRLLEMMDKLKPEYRDIIILKEISGYSMREISVVMGKSVSAVKTLHHRAIKKLRGIFFRPERKAFDGM